jgi:hypothetical protein
MRRILLVIIVMFIAAQAFANTVTLSVTDRGNYSGWASIGYSADANVSGFGLMLTADSGAVFTGDVCDYNVGECNATIRGYGIFPGEININPTTGVVNSYGTPVCPNTSPGASGSGPGTGALIVEMGALFVEPNEPPRSGTLLSVRVNTDCNVCVAGEPVRGNVVMQDSTQANLISACSHIRITPAVTVYTLTVASQNPNSGVTITASPPDNYSISSGSTQFTLSYNSGTSVSLTAPQYASGNIFKEWDKDGVFDTSSLTDSLTVSANHTMTAVYTSFYALTVTSRDTTGVAITVSPSDNNGLSNGSTVFTRYYPSGTSVSLTAPSTVTYGGSTYNFRQWDQDGNTAYAYTAATSLTMGAAHTMQVEYECFPSSDPNYTNWATLGKPICWCYARQCYGNASGASEGKSPNIVWVGNNDLLIMTNAWLATPAQIAAAPEPNGCAEFSRAPEGKTPNVVAVGNNDLLILTNNWLTSPPANCVPGNRDPNNR